MSRSAIASERLRSGASVGEDRELVATEARDEVAVPHRVRDALRDGLQQRVAGGVAERVVDDLEVVEVDEQDRRDRLASRSSPTSRTRSRLHLEGAPVGGSGQGVALGEVLDVAQQDGIAQVEGGDRAHLLEDRGDASIDAPEDARAMLHDDRADRTAVGHHRRDEEVHRVRHDGGQERIERRVQRSTARISRRSQRTSDDRVRNGRRRGRRCRRRCEARMII